MFGDKFLQRDISTIGHICIVSKRKDASCWKYGREEDLRPEICGVFGSPCFLTTAFQAVDEDDAGSETLGGASKLGCYILDCAVIGAAAQFAVGVVHQSIIGTADQFDAGREDLSR